MPIAGAHDICPGQPHAFQRCPRRNLQGRHRTALEQSAFLIPKRVLQAGTGPPEVVTGGIDGAVRIWDMRQHDAPVAAFLPQDADKVASPLHDRISVRACAPASFHIIIGSA